jgi:hypothetical protein
VYVDASEITPEGSGKFTTGGEELAPPPHAENNNTLEIITAPLNLARNLFDSILHSRPSRIVFSVATDTGWLEIQQKQPPARRPWSTEIT